jgi:hypothetical protein
VQLFGGGRSLPNIGNYPRTFGKQVKTKHVYTQFRTTEGHQHKHNYYPHITALVQTPPFQAITSETLTLFSSRGAKVAG